MKNKIVTTAMLITLMTLFFGSLKAQNGEKKTRFSIETDPATFAFGGYAAHLRIQPKNSDHFLFGVGTYAMDLPDMIVDLNSNNKNMGWKVRLNQGYGLFAERHFTEVNRKWFIGAQASLQEHILEKDYYDGDAKFTNALFMGYAGYTLKPFKNELYFKPWAGIGYQTKISGDNMLGDAEYDISPISMFVTLHVGYTF
jgi:hypothetical protein